MTLNQIFPVLAVLVLVSVFPVQAEKSAPIDLSRAVIVAKPELAQAAAMLSGEIARRSGNTLTLVAAVPPASPSIILDTANAPDVPDKADGYAIWVDSGKAGAPRVHLTGYDARGVLFAAGRLIRLLDFGAGSVNLAPDTRVSTAPAYPQRGTQIGYRDTANSYDAWDLPQFEQYVRDMILFGANSIELIPSLEPGKTDGKVMKRPVWDATIDQARVVNAYGLDLWFWMAALKDLSKPEEAQAELERWGRLFKSIDRIGGVFVPGGDDGDNLAQHLMPWLKELAKVLRESHPEATLWVSNQTFEADEDEYFFKYLETEANGWLTGVVYGPWSRMTVEQLRQRTPSGYPIRDYPDLTHTARCQYPVSKWDTFYAHTLGREPVCPRPRAMSQIFRRTLPFTSGIISYSDGIHDDFNKVLSIAMAWDPEITAEEVLRDYGRAFFTTPQANAVADGLSRLESNWDTPARDSAVQTESTLLHWETIAVAAPALPKENWRFQMYLFRACYDAHVQHRAVAEGDAEARALEALKAARTLGPEEAVAQAQAALNAETTDPDIAELRQHLEDLGKTLLASIGYQLSAKPPYNGKSPERGAVLDFLDTPLNSRVWLTKEMQAALDKNTREDKVQALEALAAWQDPGPGGFYDDLGDAWKQPRLVIPPDAASDPGFLHSPQCEFMDTPELRLSWQDQAQTIYGAPLKMHYDGLDPKAEYRLRIVYAGRFKPSMRLVANGAHEVHGPMEQPSPVNPLEFKVPGAATKGGTLDLEWQLVKGRGCQVAEVWLFKQGGK
jgi:hypothetical protein